MSTPEGVSPAGALSAPVHFSVTERALRTRLRPVSMDSGARRSIACTAPSAAAALTIPQPRSAFQPLPAGRVAVSFSVRMMSATDASGFSSRAIAATPATIGAAIDVPCRYAKRESPPKVTRQRQFEPGTSRLPPASSSVGLPGKPAKMPAGPPPASNAPGAASEICEPRPANEARWPPKFAAVTTSPRPAARSPPLPLGCSRLDG